MRREEKLSGEQGGEIVYPDDGPEDGLLERPRAEPQEDDQEEDYALPPSRDPELPGAKPSHA